MQGRPPARLTRLPSWLLSQAALAGHRAVNEQLAAAGMRRHHFTILVALEEDGPASQADLGRRLWMDRSDMAAAVAELEGEGLVSRRRDERDRRRNVVAITPAGRARLARLAERVDAAQRLLLEPLTDAERRELVGLLRRVVEHHQAAA
jgi:DNA-binding MarR family transcriptional regulator